MKIILISGKAGHGKSATADILKSLLESQGKKIEVAYFSNQIKKLAKEDHGWDGVKDEKGRKLLQDIGMEKRKLDPDYWINLIVEYLRELEGKIDIILIPDVRFKREISSIKAIFPSSVFCLEVIRKDFRNNLTHKQRNHPSEIDLDDYKFDHTMNVQGGLDNLAKEVTVFLEANCYKAFQVL